VKTQLKGKRGGGDSDGVAVVQGRGREFVGASKRHGHVIEPVLVYKLTTGTTEKNGRRKNEGATTCNARNNTKT